MLLRVHFPCLIIEQKFQCHRVHSKVNLMPTRVLIQLCNENERNWECSTISCLICNQIPFMNFLYAQVKFLLVSSRKVIFHSHSVVINIWFDLFAALLSFTVRKFSIIFNYGSMNFTRRVKLQALLHFVEVATKPNAKCLEFCVRLVSNNKVNVSMMECALLLWCNRQVYTRRSESLMLCDALFFVFESIDSRRRFV